MRQDMVGGCFETDKHQVSRTNFLRDARRMGMNMKVAFGALNPDAVLAHRVIIRSQKKVDLVPCAAQFCAVITSQRSRSNHRDFHNAINMPGESLVIKKAL